MKAFYFFQITREHNSSNEYRTVLHPLPDQLIYGTQDYLVPSFKVQLSLHENSKAVRLSSGDIVGVRLESNRLRDLRLSERTRGGVRFYRTEAEIFLVHSAYIPHVPNLNEADSEMLQAYRELISPNGSDASSEGAQAPEAAAQAVNVNPVEPHATPARTAQPISFNPDELRSVEDVLRLEMSEREALTKLLTISQIKDRLTIGVARFTFIKQNGDTRIAYGTRNAEVMRHVEFIGNDNRDRDRQQDGAHFTYFDIQKKDWRSFCTPDIVSCDVSFFLRPDQIREIQALAS